MPQPLYSQEKSSSIHWKGGWMGLRACPDLEVEGPKMEVLAGIQTSVIQPIAY
jgi:hypothetical protein